MCGRFALATEKRLLEMLFDIEIREDIAPRYNIAPSQQVKALRLSPVTGNRELVDLKWGLVPFWAGEASIGAKMINARSETAAEKPSFRDAFRKRRALVPASGFFEWKEEGGGKNPYYIYRRDGRPFVLAALWERWEKGDAPLETVAILTTAPNSLLAELHNRMPVILPEETFSRWLDPLTDPAVLRPLLSPSPPEELAVRPVSRLVNNPANDRPEVLK